MRLHSCSIAFEISSWSLHPFDLLQHHFCSFGIRFSSSIYFCIRLLITDVMSLYIVGQQVTGLQFFGFSVLSFFGTRNVTPTVNHSGIWSSSINLLKSAGICLCVAGSCLGQKFAIWALLDYYYYYYCEILRVIFITWVSAALCVPGHRNKQQSTINKVFLQNMSSTGSQQ